MRLTVIKYEGLHFIHALKTCVKLKTIFCSLSEWSWLTFGLLNLKKIFLAAHQAIL